MRQRLLALTTAFCATTSGALTLTDAVFKGIKKTEPLEGQRTLYDLSGQDRWRRFIPNEPQLSFSSSDDGVAESIGVSEAVSFPGKSLALSRIDAEKERAQQSEYVAKKHEVASQVVQAYLDCASAKASVEQQIATTTDLETLASSIKARYETGHGTQSENISTELQLRQQKTDLDAAKDKQANLCRVLGTLLSINESDLGDIELSDDLDEKIVKELGDHNADEERSQAALRLSDANSSTAWWSQLPDFTLSANKNHYFYLPGSPSGKEWTMTYTASVTVPIFFPFYEGAEARRARAQASVDHYNAEVQLIHARSDKEDAKKTYQRSKKRLQELRMKDLAMAKALMESSYSSYKSGKIGFAELVLAQRTLSDLRAQDIQLRNSIISSHLKCLSDCNTTSDKMENSIQ